MIVSANAVNKCFVTSDSQIVATRKQPSCSSIDDKSPLRSMTGSQNVISPDFNIHLKWSVSQGFHKVCFATRNNPLSASQLQTNAFHEPCRSHSTGKHRCWLRAV
jgi:hypothetical protein